MPSSALKAITPVVNVSGTEFRIELTPAELINSYIQLRDKIAQIKEAHKEQLKPYQAMTERLEGLLLAELNAAGANSIATPQGTAFKQVATSVSVQDWPAALEFIKTRQAWDLLEARIAKTAALATIEETESPIPGVDVSRAWVVRVRRS